MRDLLLISDLHLGSHLKARTRGEFVHLAARIEDNLPRFLDYYAARGEWQLVINGDFIDFWNIEIGDERDEPEKVAIQRLHAVLDEHPGVEDALVRFLEAGNGIVIVAGNHDAEFLYPKVRRAMAERLEGAMKGRGDASITRTGMTRLDALEGGRVRFVPWFLREDGGAWIEHGHLFDPACSTDAQLHPTRRGRLVQSVAEVATRKFTNLMPEMEYDSADHFTTMDYVRWAAARGLRFGVRVVLLYLRMVGHIVALWVRTGRVDKEGKARHEESMARVAANAGLQMSALTALQKMAPPPSSARLGGVLSVTALDYVLSVVVPLVLGVGIFWLIGRSLVVGFLLGAVVAAIGFVRVQRSRSPRDIARDMLGVAAQVGEVTGVPLVLMGHSHHGSLERLGDVLYGNSGSWLDGSHLVVLRNAEGLLVEAELRRWRNGGIARLQTQQVPRRLESSAEESGTRAPTAAAEAGSSLPPQQGPTPC